MPKEISRVTIKEITVADAVNVAQVHIDNFWAAVDLSHALLSMEITAKIDFTVANASGTEKTFRFTFNWFEDTAVQDTRLQAIYASFGAALTAMEGASSYTTVVSVNGTILMTIIYQ